MSDWKPIETAPKEGMFIYAVPKTRGKWGIGLAYNTVSNTQVDHISAEALHVVGATLWHPLPPPP